MVLVTATGAWAVAVGILLGFGIWTLISLAPRMRGPRLANRIAPYLVDVSAEARAHVAPRSADPLPVVGMLFAPIGTRARSTFADLLGGRESIARRLRQAGSTLSADAFRSQQLLWGIGGLAVGGLAASASCVCNRSRQSCRSRLSWCSACSASCCEKRCSRVRRSDGSRA